MRFLRFEFLPFPWTRPWLAGSLLTLACLPGWVDAQEAAVVNLSTRARTGLAAEVLTTGFTLGPGNPQTVLIRAVGPTLARFGVEGNLADPILTLFDASGRIVATNDTWSEADAPVHTAVGAFALPSGSRDAALVATLPAGSYTAQVTGAGSSTGLALVEIYAADTTGSRLVNLSTRAQVGTGAQVMIPGFVVAPGTSPRRLLVRAAGPALAGFGLGGTLADPELKVLNGAGVTVASNDNWETAAGPTAASAPQVPSAFSAAGAFAFSAGSRDAALLADLPAGSYTVQVSGVSGGTGLALVELYDVTGAGLVPTGSTTLLATAATGDAIRHPTYSGTSAVTDGGRTVQIPESMVYVPAGAFTYGSGSSATSISIDAYAIGKYEVTNAEWKAFLDATGSRSYPSHWSNGTYPAGKAAHPVLYVSLTSAQAYCAWVSRETGWSISIPTAQQWEKAARGPNATLYPWGNNLDASYQAATGILTTKCNYNAVVAAYYLYQSPDQTVTYNDSHSPYFNTKTTVSKIAGYSTTGAATAFAITASGNVNGWVNHDTYTGFIYTDLFDSINAVGGTTSPVGTYPAGRSAYGCHDMAGNVWEWTSTVTTATNGVEAGQAVNEVRGGSWYATGSSCRSIGIGEGRSPTGNYNTIGFRVVMTPR